MRPATESNKHRGEWPGRGCTGLQISDFRFQILYMPSVRVIFKSEIKDLQNEIPGDLDQQQCKSIFLSMLERDYHNYYHGCCTCK
jgi:hypothetical protein